MIRAGDLKRALVQVNDDTLVRVVSGEYGDVYMSLDVVQVRVSDDGTKLFFVPEMPATEALRRVAMMHVTRREGVVRCDMGWQPGGEMTPKQSDEL